MDQRDDRRTQRRDRRHDGVSPCLRRAIGDDGTGLAAAALNGGDGVVEGGDRAADGDDVQAAPRERLDAAPADAASAPGDHRDARPAGVVHDGHQIDMPPSMAKSAPVTKLARGDARNSTASAISTGSPMRRIGVALTSTSFM